MFLKPEQTILFQGDSITDAARNKNDPYAMGSGYAHMVSATLGATYPHLNLSFLNRGIAGNRVPDLQERWRTDCLNIKPDWLSIMIGINDCWRRYDRNLPTSTEAFEHNYRNLLNETKKNLPDTKLILLEPFVLPFPEDRIKWREDLDPKIQTVRQIARDYETILIPLDGIFAAASTQRPCAFWANDGVHPSAEGHALIAQAWLQAVKALS